MEHITPIVVAIIASIGVGEGIDFGQDYAKEIAELERTNEIIKDEVDALWQEAQYDIEDITHLYEILCYDLANENACYYLDAP